MFCTRCGASFPDNSTFCPSCGSPVQRPPAAPAPFGTPAVPPPPVPPVAPAPWGGSGMPVAPVSLDYASWGSRVIGYLIDNLIVLVVVIPLAIVAGMLGAGAAAVDSLSRFGGNIMGSSCCCILLLFPIVQIAFGIYNRIYLVAQRGYSIGQGVAKIKTVDGYGNLLPSSTLWLRLLVQVLLGMVPVVGILDLLWPLWDERRQTLHDKAVNSYVINWPQAVAMP